MKNKKIVFSVLLLFLVANLSVEFSYSLHLSGYDYSMRGSDTFIELDNGEKIRLEEGEEVFLRENLSGKKIFRGEFGWLETPVKSQKKVKISFRSFDGLPPEFFSAATLIPAISSRREDSFEYLSGRVPVVFNEEFPEGYKNDVRWWGNIGRDKLHSLLPDGTAKLLTMDVDIGDVCGLRCPHCFRRDSRFDDVEKGNKLSHEEIVGYVKEAKDLGLEQIKILGRGEPFQNPRFLEFLEEMTNLDVGVAVFTKGFVLGNDFFAEKYNHGIHSAKKLVERLKSLKVSILLGFNSFRREIQEGFVGTKDLPENARLKNYVDFRDNALINLVEAGFNEYKKGEATRLMLSAAPVKPENIDEIFDIYKWARVRNIYMLTCPTNLSGKGLDQFQKEKMIQDYANRLEEEWTKIYVWAIQTNLIPLDIFKEDGVSLYPGCHVCNQAAAGFYLNLSGQVNQCPGRVDKTTIFSSDIRMEKSLRDVWMNSPSYKRAKYGKAFNYHCVARDGHSLSKEFYKNIEKKVLSQVS